MRLQADVGELLKGQEIHEQPPVDGREALSTVTTLAEMRDSKLSTQVMQNPFAQI